MSGDVSSTGVSIVGRSRGSVRGRGRWGISAIQAGPRLVFIALDALEHSVLSGLAQRGRLPNLARFMNENAVLTVGSDGEILHGSLWPTFASGAGPGVHGRYFWTQWLAEEMRHVRNSHPAFAYEPFWADIARAGYRVTVVDVPYAPLVTEPNVRQINAWGTHDELEPEAWPDGWGKQFRKRFGNHPLEFDTVEPQSSRDKLEMAQAMRRGVGMRARALETLLRDGESDFLICSFGETHKAGHYLASAQELKPGLTNLDAIGKILQPLDDAWPRIEAAAGPHATICLFALHGTREQVDFSAGLGQPLLARALDLPAAAAEGRPDLLRRVRDLLPDRLHRAIWRHLPARLRAARQGQLSGALTDPARDPLLAIAHDGHLALRANLAGRERDGLATSEQAEAALDQLEGLAAQFRLPEGGAAFGGLYRAQVEHPGPRAHRLPDALLIARPDVPRASRLVSPGGEEIVSAAEEARNGVHTGRGFAYLRPAAGQPAPVRTDLDNLDFAPSILSYFGLPPRPEFRGSSLFA